MKAPDFTRDELLAFLGVSDTPPDDMLTSREWEARLGVSRPMMARVLEAAKARGVLRVGKARREAIDGRNALVSVYGFDVAR
jgi:hypothetical protein